MQTIYLSHHGVKGQKWGIRRYQNEDGSLTPAGEKKYTKNTDGSLTKKPMSTGKKVVLGLGITALTTGAVVAGKAVLDKYKENKINKQVSKKGQEWLLKIEEISSRQQNAIKKFENTFGSFK